MPSNDEPPPFLDTPAGLLTASGTHFHTTRALLEQYARPVLDVVPLATLIDRAEVWLRSGQALALWALALLLLLTSPVGAVVGALAVYIGWETLGPLLVSQRLVAVFLVLEKAFVQAVLYVAVLSTLGAQGRIAAVAVGLVGFVLVRWRLLPMVLRPALEAVRRPLYTLPTADQILRGFVLRAALHHGIALPQLERLKREWRRRPS